MVACLALLSQGRGKYYLVKTKDNVSRHHYESEAGVDYNSEDDDKCNTKKLLYDHLYGSQLYEFEHMTPNNQEMLLESMDEVIDNAKKGKDGQDYNLNIIERIKEITLKSENLLKGINRLLTLVSESKDKYKRPKCKRKTRYDSDKSKKPRRCKKAKRCKKSIKPHQPKKKG